MDGAGKGSWPLPFTPNKRQLFYRLHTHLKGAQPALHTDLLSRSGCPTSVIDITDEYVLHKSFDALAFILGTTLEEIAAEFDKITNNDRLNERRRAGMFHACPTIPVHVF